ncbi:MAG: hypothetical protein L3J06_09255 [Cyclobacteriaceae bacterium]|nr:hypothetical protein [Cyclobacteriaceae bacterium]
MKCTKHKYWIFFLLLNAYSVSLVYGQEIYQIKGAVVIIEFDYGDSILQLQSRHLHIKLNNGNAEFIAKLNLNTLINTDDKNKQKQIFLSEEEVLMIGKFKVDYIETSNHVPLQFEFSGVLSQNEVVIPVQGNAELQHVGGGGSISCMLGFSFILDSDVLKKNNLVKPNLRKVKVQVLQTVLKRNNY